MCSRNGRFGQENSALALTQSLAAHFIEHSGVFVQQREVGIHVRARFELLCAKNLHDQVVLVSAAIRCDKKIEPVELCMTGSVIQRVSQGAVEGTLSRSQC